MLLTNLLKEFNTPNKREDGEMTLYNHKVVWRLHIAKGTLLYASDQRYSIRRWDRALRQQGSTWSWSPDVVQLTRNQSWECHLLDKGICHEQLSLIRAKLMIRTIVQECFFELSNDSDFDYKWESIPKSASTSYRSAALSVWELQTVFNKAMRIYQQWQSAGLAHLSPNLSPTLMQAVDPQFLPLAQTYLNGQFMLWDIAWQVEKSVTEIACQLLPLVEKNLLQFQEVADSPLPPIKPSTPTVALPEASSVGSPERSAVLTRQFPLIACIDDSPVLAHTLNKILVAARYRTLSIPEPMRGFTQLIEHKPDLILLDLLLPNADGYSICKFLRDTPLFQKTPIIILTAQNTSIDRALATLAGATDFLGKPPKPEALLQMIRKYLPLQDQRQSSEG